MMFLKSIFVLGMRTVKATPQDDPEYFGFLLASFVLFGPIHTLIRTGIHIFWPRLLEAAEAAGWRDMPPSFVAAILVSIATTWMYLDARSGVVASELAWVPTFDSYVARIVVTVGGFSLALLLIYLSFEQLIIAVLATVTILAACELAVRRVKRRIESTTSR